MKMRLRKALNRVSVRVAYCILLPIRFFGAIPCAVRYGLRVRPALMRRSEGVIGAVVVHLFYVDNWGLFAGKLRSLPKSSFDLFVTLPKQNEYFKSEIFKSFPNANIVIVPNRGRDVLPFIKIARILINMGYIYVLKFHSKRSVHRSDGQEWLEDMLNKLLPNDNGVIDNMRAILLRGDTGIIGPARVYYPLTVNFPANGAHMTRVISRLYGGGVASDVLQVHRGHYGFFGGTMFWARLDAIEPLVNAHAFNFEPEMGQIDATFAHALERLFCIVPEINGRKMYETSGEDVILRTYSSNNIPEWSRDHLK